MARIPNIESDHDMKIAAFNAALGVTVRLNGIFDMCMEAAHTLNGHKWFHLLHSAQREISSKMTSAELKETDTMLKDVSSSVADSLRRKGMNESDYLKLDLIEKKLRKVADEKQLLIPDKKTVMDFMREL